MPASIILETPRLALRELNTDDGAFILQLLNEPAWLQHIGDRGIHSLEAARGYILDRFVETYRRHGFGPCLVARKEDGASIGICGLLKRDTLPDVDLGFAFLSEFWNRGYANEAATATLAYGKSSLHLDRIVAIVSPGNVRSRRVLEKLDFRFERITRLAADAPEVMLYAASR